MIEAIDLSMVFDGAIAILLMATIVSAVILNRRLSNLRDGRADMEALIAHLTEATEAAQDGLGTLRQHAEESAGSLRSGHEAGRALVDELGYLVEKGSALSGRLEGAIGTARRAGGAPARMRSPPSSRVSAADAESTPPGDVSRPLGDDGQPGPMAPAPAKESKLLGALQGVR